MHGPTGIGGCGGDGGDGDGGDGGGGCGGDGGGVGGVGGPGVGEQDRLHPVAFPVQVTPAGLDAANQFAGMQLAWRVVVVVVVCV